jgi:hypothetical protein
LISLGTLRGFRDLPLAPLALLEVGEITSQVLSPDREMLY